MNELFNDRFQCSKNGVKIHMLFVAPADKQLGPNVKSNIGYYHFDLINHQSQIKDHVFLV